MFESPFNSNSSQSSTLFRNPAFGNYNSPERYADLYYNMELAKQKQYPLANQQQAKTVFTDISEEWNSMSEDTRRFIENSKEYAELSAKYQNDFYVFLMETFGNDFLKSKYGTTPEKVLALIREKKEEYNNKFAENLNEIREQNNELAERNNQLAKTNQELQLQLADIRKRLGGIDYEVR